MYKFILNRIFQILVIVIVALCSVSCNDQVQVIVPTRDEITEMGQGGVPWLDPERSETWEKGAKPYYLFFVNTRSFWSRKMVQETFTIPEIIGEIGILTRPVWIDADLRPDLVDRFSLGAIPSVAILTPDKRWVTGTTFMEQEDMTALLRRIRIWHDIPDRQADLERERGRLLKRRPYAPAEFVRDRNPEDLISILIDSLRVSDVRIRSGEVQILLDDRGHQDQTRAWLDTHTDKRLLNDQGIFVTDLRSTDGKIRDEMTSLGRNAGLLYTIAWFAHKKAEPILQKESYRLAQALVASLHDQEKRRFFAGTADFSFTDSTKVIRHIAGSPGLLDGRTITAWNALMVSALNQVLLGQPDDDLAQIMKTTLDQLLSDCVHKDVVYRTPERQNRPTLDDAAHLVRACLDYSEFSDDDFYAIRARELSLRALYLSDGIPSTDSGVLEGDQDLIGADGDYGSAAGVFAQSLVRLSKRADGETFRARALRICRDAIARDIERLPRLGAVGRALLLFTKDQKVEN